MRRMKSFVLTFALIVNVPAAGAGFQDTQDQEDNSGGGVLTPRLMSTLRVVRSAKISPDGNTIAYTLSIPRDPGREEDGRARIQLHLVNTKSGESRPFITDESGVSNVQWSPDGESIYFLARRGDDEHTSLYRIPIDGGEASRVLQHESSILNYDLAPDGRIFFIAVEKVSEEIESLQEKGFKAEIFEEDWRPRQVWLHGSQDEAPTLLPLEGSAFDLQVSPDARLVAVALAPRNLVDDSYMFKRVHIVETETGNVVQKFENSGKLGEMRWSPGSARLALISAETINDSSTGNLLIATVGYGPLTDITPDAQADIHHVAWQNHDDLLFVGSKGVYTTFGEVSLDKTSKYLTASELNPAITSLSLAKDGQSAAFVGSTANHPAEVYFMRHGDTEVRRLTHSNPELDSVRLAEQEVLRYKARDGLEIEGLYLPPLNAGTGPHPLILVVHGDPKRTTTMVGSRGIQPWDRSPRRGDSRSFSPTIAEAPVEEPNSR